MFKVFATKENNTDAAIKEVAGGIEGSPSVLMVYGTCNHDWDLISNTLNERYGHQNVKILGGTSCLGVLTNQDFYSENGHGLGVLAINDFDGDIGVGSSFSKNAKDACEALVNDADRKGEMPDFIWMLSSPGDEEKSLEEITKYFGGNVKVFGGSCGDNDISGKWKLLHGKDMAGDGIILVGFYSHSHEIFSSFHSGYAPTSETAVVTKSNGREVVEFNNKDAYSVYDGWLEGKIKEKIDTGANNILAESTLYPLGRIVGTVKDVPYYLLSHPESVTSESGVTLFTNIQEGDEVTLMKGSVESLENRLAEVVETLMAREGIEKDEVAGGLIIYCAGCMLAVNSENLMQSVAKKLNNVVGDAPFIGIHTFGEQGCFFEEDHGHHGNLMISATIFKRK